MPIKIFTNNNVKMNRSLKSSGGDVLYSEFAKLFRERAKEWHEYFLWSNGERRNKMVQYIKFYKKERLLGLKQTYFSPVDYTECWEIREKDFTFTHTISRESGVKKIESLMTNRLSVEYKNIRIDISNRMFDAFRLGDIYNEVFRFFKVLTDYSEEYPVKEMVVETGKKKEGEKK